jgi:opacity protein-like surface antigen
MSKNCTKFFNNTSGILAILCFIIFLYDSGFSQYQEQKFNLGASAGFIIFDKDLSFNNSLSFGIDGTYSLSSLLKLNLSFSYSPTHQEILMAVSKLKTRFSIYSYIISLKLYKTFPELFQITPFVHIGTGGITIAPQTSPVFFDVGGGQKVQLKLSTDHKLAVRLGAGLTFPVYKNLDLTFEYQKFLYRLQVSETLNEKYKTGNNNYLGIGVSFF